VDLPDLPYNLLIPLAVELLRWSIEVHRDHRKQSSTRDQTPKEEPRKGEDRS
jgi:hypothetical protein